MSPKLWSVSCIENLLSLNFVTLHVAKKWLKLSILVDEPFTRYLLAHPSFSALKTIPHARSKDDYFQLCLFRKTRADPPFSLDPPSTQVATRADSYGSQASPRLFFGCHDWSAARTVCALVWVPISRLHLVRKKKSWAFLPLHFQHAGLWAPLLFWLSSLPIPPLQIVDFLLRKKSSRVIWVPSRNSLHAFPSFIPVLRIYFLVWWKEWRGHLFTPGS